jgi:hypothetical protein
LFLLRHGSHGGRTLALRSVVVLVLVLIVVAPWASYATGGSRVLYLDVYSYANNLTAYKRYPPDNEWAGYRIRYEQDDSSQVTTNPNYNDYHFATDCDYNGGATPGFVDIKGRGSFFVYSETAKNRNDATALRTCAAKSANGRVDLVLMAPYGCARWRVCWSRGGPSVWVGAFAAELYISNRHAESEVSRWDPGIPASWVNNQTTVGVLNISPYLHRAGTPNAGLPLSGDGSTIETKVKQLCAESATGALVVYSSKPVAVIGNQTDQHAGEQYVIKGMNDCINAGY